MYHASRRVPLRPHEHGQPSRLASLLGDTGMEVLAQAPFLEQLTDLSLDVTRVGDAGIQELVAGKTDVPGLLKSLDEAYNQK